MIKKEKLGDIAEVITGVRTITKEGPTELKNVIKKPSFELGSQLNYEYEPVPVGINPKFYSKKGDIVISLAGANTVCKIEHEGFIIPMAFAIVRVKDGYDADFIYHLLKSEIFPRELNKLIEGGLLRIIKTHQLKQIILPIPDYETQKQYGELFNLMDKRITLNLELAKTEEKIEKGLLNNLLGDDD